MVQNKIWVEADFYDLFECEICDSTIVVNKDYYFSKECPNCKQKYWFDVDDLNGFEYSKKIMIKENND